MLYKGGLPRRNSWWSGSILWYRWTSAGLDHR